MIYKIEIEVDADHKFIPYVYGADIDGNRGEKRKELEIKINSKTSDILNQIEDEIEKQIEI